MLVLHDDAEREYAHGPAEGLPDTKVGAFTQELYDEAKRNGWIVISMKSDWKRIFADAPRLTDCECPLWALGDIRNWIGDVRFLPSSTHVHRSASMSAKCNKWTQSLAASLPKQPS